MKKIWTNLAGRIWLIVTTLVIVLAVLLNILLSTVFFSAVSLVFGGPTVVLTGEEKSNYTKDFETKAESLANGNRVSKEIAEEGFTLLKNKDAALPLKATETKVSVFGKNSVNLAIGGSGSGGSEGRDAVSLFDNLTASGFTYNQTLVDFYNNKNTAKSGEGRAPNSNDLDSGGAINLTEKFVGETPVGNYTDVEWDSCENYKHVALVVLTRVGGEGFDLPRTESDHILKLRPAEKDLIAKVKTLGFGKVVLVLNAAATLELKEVNEDDGIDAILWIGFAGGNGMSAFGGLLKGETADGVKFSPSGKTVDTYAADFSHNPVWENFGAALGGDAYTLTGGKSGVLTQPVHFVDYEEGIYVGYRFYETAYAESLKGNRTMGGYDFDYAKEVVYPFGYGLSYTRFDWTLENEGEVKDKVLEADTSLTFKIKVTNKGGYPGRDVVQLYVTPPDNGSIEKSAKLLVGFAKTGLLPDGASETVEITVDSPYEFASYDYNDANKNGFKGYEAERGTYTFSVSTDAHTPVISVDTHILPDVSTAGASIKYEKDPVTGTAVVNLFTGQANASMNADTELGVILSRNGWQDTWPARRTAGEKKADDREDWLNAMQSPASVSNRPTDKDKVYDMGKSNSITLSQLTGLGYDDPLWEDFLDQLKMDEMNKLVNQAAFKTVAIERLGVPETIAADGPVGFVNFIGSTSIYDTCVYPCQVVVSSTWNVDRLYDMGEAIGNEALVGDSKHGGMPYTGWYAPGLNIHRAPFGGRNFEYYSEDAFLSGKMTAAIMKGAASKGVYTDIKHFALNDQETHRGINGLVTWANEQSIREIYLKAFEIALKTAKADGVKAMGVMSSFNRIGEVWTGGDYRLLTTILRGEWGFEGVVICDFNTNSHMNAKDMIYAGGDLNLELIGASARTYYGSATNASDVTAFRQASKNILYTVANSNAMRGDFKMSMPTWQLIMIVVDCVLFVGFAVWGFFVIRRSLKTK